MELQTEQLSDGIMKVILAGRLDIAGTDAVDLHFTAVTASAKSGVVVDMSAVSFLASIAIRMLLSNAKALNRRGHKMVIFKPAPMVRKTLVTTGIDTLIPLYDDIESALQLFQQT